VIGILRGKQSELRSLANHIQAPGGENMPRQGLQQMIRGEFGGRCAQRKIVWPSAPRQVRRVARQRS
jgi:hypothetical protein